ncbi:unnamed protein product [Phyllotreta striolata]|uniref:Lipase domain-containing protein n=1 Tax=Phyllotreta striolata TaxID=444603 RepID=A0A9N9TLQ8_PHYSR|nr:unnamed protein product [Phyllotreta striolata]
MEKISWLLWSLFLTVAKAEFLDDLFAVSKSDVKIYFSNRNNSNNFIEVDLSDPQQVATAGFSKAIDSYICVRAYNEETLYKNNSCNQIKKALLELHDVNFFYVDWSKVSDTINYIGVLMKIPKVAKLVAHKILDLINKSGLDPNRTQLIGASLGAQMAGAIGTELEGILYQVVGLDPSSPFLSRFYSGNRMSKNSGQFVQAIHTGGFFFGFFDPLGHADYYANGGRLQPSCKFDLIGFCSHTMVGQLYIKTLQDEKLFLANKCDSELQYNLGACQNNEKSYVGGYLVDRNNRNNSNIFIEVDLSNPQQVATAGFSKAIDSYICVRAYNEKGPSTTCDRIKKALLELHDVNFFYVDWSKVSDTINFLKILMKMPNVAKLVARKIIDLINKSGLDPNTTQMIGVSLGGQLAGAIGTELEGILYQVIGLDPSWPFLSPFYSGNRMSKNSGQFVQAIHTGGIFLGYFDPLGHADYYANGGRLQPSCKFDLIGYCSHTMVEQLYIKTLQDEKLFLATKCDSELQYNLGACQSNEKSYVGGYLVDRK